MKSPACFSLLASLALLSAAPAQWRTTTYYLKPGWMAVYLNGDASWQTPDEHFAGQPDIVEVWRWNASHAQAQFSTDPSDPFLSTPEWSVWRRGQPQYSDLTVMTGQTPYLVKLRDGAPAQSFALKQRVEPPVLTWARAGANLLAFPSKKTGTQFPTFASYFATFPAATAGKIYRYNGGPLDTANPVRAFSMTSERVDSTQAYWFEAKTVGDFLGPLSFELSDPTGLNFAATRNAVTLTIRNRTTVTQTLTFTPVNSESAPPGQPSVAGPVALTRRVFNSASAAYDDIPLSSPWTATIAAGGTLTTIVGIDRTGMAGPPGSVFASLLRITDAANMMDVHLPATAGSVSMAGLWVGDVSLTNVESKTPGSTGTATGSSFPLRYLIHVDDSGRATLLSSVFIGSLASDPNVRGVATTEAALKQDQLGSALRLTAAHMPLDRVIPAAGAFGTAGSITGTINLPYDDATNPFVHQYHPDHDNKNARFQPAGNGVESWTANRAVTFTFAATAPPGLSGSWGSRVLAGNYAETITGIHKQPVTATGTFTLRRVSESGTLVTAP